MKTKRTKRRYSQGLRAEAAEATGHRIVDVFLERLMTQWYDEITLDAVAGDADVTVMTIVRRFGGKEQLLEEAVKRFSDQVHATRGKAEADVGSIVDNLVKDYEHSGDMVIRLLALEGRHEALRPILQIGRRYHRQWVGSVFEKELSTLSGEQKERATSALVIAADVYTWKLLRRDMKQSVSEAAIMMKKIIQSVLAGFVK
jgi:AcrR family transcriptional regulator